jgi:hypothetical protein
MVVVVATVLSKTYLYARKEIICEKYEAYPDFCTILYGA